ncbi:alpha/beta fold hydrolase [Rhodococcoides trifolii]|uniref:alpha/beta fold hydrolase n=1 Tax=Rhodococcoides trifolii TaxID=908250 RepID=UPI00166A7F69|nr:alpha/beta hydrolase [Rhodococcus trifolii]
MPGTGSDARFVEEAFGPAVANVGSAVTAVRPEPSALVAGYRRALDLAAEAAVTPIVVGGVSIGAAVALGWAADNPGRVAAVLVALPAWTGDGSDAPAAASAHATADLLRSIGLEAAIAAMTASSPPWLSRMLSRSWREQWPDLPAALDEAAQYTSPTTQVLRTVRVPVGIVAAVDDPVHPVDVARHWAAEIPVAALTTLTLDRLGTDPSVLGRLCVDAVRGADEKGSAQLLHG